MTEAAAYAAGALASYLLGSIPYGYLIGRARGVDLTSRGSGNIGATNAGRLLGFRYFVLVLLLDVAKGFVPSFFIAPWLAANFPDSHWHVQSFWLSAIFGACAVLGHIFPLWTSFRGGKGVATAFGATLAMSWPVAVSTTLLFLFVLFWIGFVSLSSISAALSAPAAYILLDERPWPDHLPGTLFFILCAILVVYRHRDNIRRLLSGQEPRALRRGAI